MARLIISRSSIIDKLCDNDLSNGLAWFYCDGARNAAGKNETKCILGSILKQLCQILVKSRPSEMAEFLEKLHDKGRSTPDSKLAILFLDNIIKMARSVVYIVIDGIDECPNRSDLCKKVLEMAGENVKVLVTSRLERDIAAVFQKQNHLEITEEFSCQDIATHINWIFQHNNKLKTLKPDMKNEIKTQLLTKSKGM